MVLVPRKVRKIPELHQPSIEGGVEPLTAFRDMAAWVLLGEPGAGKSESLKLEAQETGGRYCEISEFINFDIDANLNGRTLFLDGLDEVRASGNGDSILVRVRGRLKALGNPPFRMACRAADWYGSSDRRDLQSASLDGDIHVLVLEPLNVEDIQTILRTNHDIPEPAAFVAEAAAAGIDDLLDNPQTLEMLVKATSAGDQWPSTRDEVYRLACEKLAQESSKRRRDAKRRDPIATEQVLDAAGQLSAVLLLSDTDGVALDVDAITRRFPGLDDCSPPDPQAAAVATRSRLFRSARSEEQAAPAHRSIAEYLAARWLARRIDKEGLPLGRVLNLLLGRDSRAIAGLRGLYAWLALHCLAARQRLIEADPLTVIVYGDVTPMSTGDKRQLLECLRQEAASLRHISSDVSVAHRFGALANIKLQPDFLAILHSQERDDANQLLVDCVLDILAHGDALPDLAPSILAIAVDDTRWPEARTNALRVWLRLADGLPAKLALLDDIAQGRVTDRDDDLTGVLLQQLYPEHMSPETLFHYFHKPKDAFRFGPYLWFWSHELSQVAPDEHLPVLLDALVGRDEVSSHDPYHMSEMAGRLLARGLATHGDLIPDDRLSRWLAIGADEYGHIQRAEKEHETVAAWLGQRPERYKGLLSLYCRECVSHERPENCISVHINRLHDAPVPDDIGLWHLGQAALTSSEALARWHLWESATALANLRGASGLSVDRLVSWGEAHPDRKHWLDPLLTYQIPDWRTDQAERKRVRAEERAESKRERTRRISPLIPQIEAGTALPRVMHQMASVWMNRYTDIRGETPAERFDSYCENGHDVFEAAKAGFPRCLSRTDLPTVDGIIDLSLNSKEHFVRLPCLLGMDFLWREDPKAIEKLSDETLRRLIAFHYTQGDGRTAEWFDHTARIHPAQVAEVLVEYASTAFKAGKDFVNGIYPLQYDPGRRAVATIAAPSLLENFPVRARSGQLNHLEHLLKAALRYAPKDLQVLIKRKLKMKGMDVAQKVYWYAAAMLVDRKNYESGLWRYIGRSATRANYLLAFLSERYGGPVRDYELSVKSTGRLIEVLAPHAEIEVEWGGGVRDVTDAVERGYQVRALITSLGMAATLEAEREIERLLGIESLRKLQRQLESAKYQLKQRQRESEFRFLPPPKVAQTLANSSPTSTSDLAALVLDHLDEIAIDIRQRNDDGFRAFWTETAENRPRNETTCRDALLTRLLARLTVFQIDCQPEGDHANDKRADITLSHRARFRLPIEVKRESDRHLWNAARQQLMARYATDPRADGYGIYLVLWFGGAGTRTATDGGKKPRSAAELQKRLEALLDADERKHIFIRVLDVSWPTPA